MEGKFFKLRLIIIAVSLYLVFAVVMFWLSQAFLTRSFGEIEQDEYENRVKEISYALDDERSFLSGWSKDWGVWDDTYSFVQDQAEDYVESNMTDGMLDSMDIDYFLIYDNNLDRKYIRSLNENGEESEGVNEELESKLLEALITFQKNNPKENVQSGTVIFDRYGIPSLFSVQPVLKSDESGPPMGYLVFGKDVGAEYFTVVGEKRNLKLEAESFNAFRGEKSTTAETLIKEDYTLEFIDNSQAKAYFLIEDYNNQPVAVITFDFRRDINLSGESARGYYLFAIWGTALAAVIIAVVIFMRLITSRRKQFEGEAKYRILFDQNVMPLLLIKSDDKMKWTEILETNQSANELYHLDKTDHYRKNPINLLYGMSHSMIKDFLGNLSSLKIAVTQGDLVIGDYKVSAEIVGRIFEVQKQKFILLSIKDLSERIQYERRLKDYAGNLKKFEMAVESASDQIVITDRDGLIIYANKAVETISGYQVTEVVGKKAGSEELWGGMMEKPYYEDLWQTIKNDKRTFEGEIKNRRKDGNEYEAAVSISPVLDEHDEVVFFVGIERDITKAKEIDRAKSEFVSLASHQLRTPLSAINWYTEMLLSGDSGKISKEQKEYLEEIYRGNKRMVELVNALLNASRIELGTFTIEPQKVNIVDLAKSVVAEMEPLRKSRAVEIKENYGELPEVMLDPKLTRIIFQNLLSNGIKYTPSKGKVGLEIKEDGDNIFISVTDTGFGIPKDQQDKVFTKLFRADNVRAMDTEGTGLGLYIIKSIVDSAHGKITFSSKEGVGTTFKVWLPISGMTEKSGIKSLD